jgi:hypothetical protein
MSGTHHLTAILAADVVGYSSRIRDRSVEPKHLSSVASGRNRAIK